MLELLFTSVVASIIVGIVLALFGNWLGHHDKHNHK